MTYRGNPQQLTNDSYVRFRTKWEPYLEELVDGTATTLHLHDNVGSSTELTISSGVITKTRGWRYNWFIMERIG